MLLQIVFTAMEKNKSSLIVQSNVGGGVAEEAVFDQMFGEGRIIRHSLFLPLVLGTKPQSLLALHTVSLNQCYQYHENIYSG